MARGIGPIQGLYESMIRRHSADGAGLQSAYADIEAGEQRAISTGTQQAISGGLFGTTILPTITQVAGEAAGRQKLAARGQQEQMLTNIQQAYANMIQRSREMVYGRQKTTARPSVTQQTQAARATNPYMQPLGASRPPAKPGPRGLTTADFPALFEG